MSSNSRAVCICLYLFLSTLVYSAEPPLLIISGPSGSSSFPNHQKVLQAAYDLIEVDVNFDVYPGKRSTLMSKSGKIDGESLRLGSYDSIVPGMIKVPTPFIVTDLRVFYRKGVKYTKPEDLGGLVVATVAGGRTTSLLAKKYGATLNEMGSSEQVIKFLSIRQSADVAIFQKNKGLEFIERFGIDNILMSDEPIIVQNFYHWLQPRHSDLIPQLDEAFKQLIADDLFNVY